MKTQKTNNNKLNPIFNIFLLFPQKDSNQHFLFEKSIVWVLKVLAFMRFESRFFRKRC